jgi:hypothetical protein
MRWFFLFLVTFFSNGCGIKKIAVKHADYLIYHETTKRLPVNSTQKTDVYSDINNFLNDSKLFATKINLILDDLNIKDERNLEKNYPLLESLYMEILDDFTKIITNQIVRLDSEQQKSFLEKMMIDNEKLNNKTKEERIESIEQKMKNILGKLDDVQKKIIVDHEEYFHQRDIRRKERKVEFCKKLLEIFGRNLSKEIQKQKVDEIFKIYQSDMLRGHKNLDIVKKFASTLNQKQLKHFSHHLENIKEILRLYIQSKY